MKTSPEMLAQAWKGHEPGGLREKEERGNVQERERRLNSQAFLFFLLLPVH